MNIRLNLIDYLKVLLMDFVNKASLSIFFLAQVTKINLLTAQRRENHILLMVVTMVSCYLLCWMPYGVVALLATFGRTGLITPITSIVPSVLAKSSTVVNPVIYVLFNNQVSLQMECRSVGAPIYVFTPYKYM